MTECFFKTTEVKKFIIRSISSQEAHISGSEIYPRAIIAQVLPKIPIKMGRKGSKMFSSIST